MFSGSRPGRRPAVLRDPRRVAESQAPTKPLRARSTPDARLGLTPATYLLSRTQCRNTHRRCTSPLSRRKPRQILGAACRGSEAANAAVPDVLSRGALTFHRRSLCTRRNPGRRRVGSESLLFVSPDGSRTRISPRGFSGHRPFTDFELRRLIGSGLATNLERNREVLLIAW